MKGFVRSACRLVSGSEEKSGLFYIKYCRVVHFCLSYSTKTQCPNSNHLSEPKICVLFIPTNESVCRQSRFTRAKFKDKTFNVAKIFNLILFVSCIFVAF